MRTLKNRLYIGVFGNIWAEQTANKIRSVRGADLVNVFEYRNREELFIDQYDYFILTDFGRQTEWSVEYRDKLNQMREIIYTRSMKSVILANNDDLDISTSLREACCRVVRINDLSWNNIPNRLVEALLNELSPVEMVSQISASAA
jgi:hypothetical protein